MKRLVLALLIIGSMASVTASARAERLEVGLAFTPTVFQDAGYEAFSEDNLSALRLGADIRAQVAEIAGFRFVPFVGYRFSTDGGNPYYIVDTEFNTHDIAVGLRVHKGLLSWLAVFAEVSGGLVVAQLDAFGHGYDYSGEIDARTDYTDRQVTWMAQGLAGAELRLPKTWLRSRGVERFGFGVELAAGYTGRGDMTFDPALESGDDNAIETVDHSWGSVNLSGWMIQVGASFKFF